MTSCRAQSPPRRRAGSRAQFKSTGNRRSRRLRCPRLFGYGLRFSTGIPAGDCRLLLLEAGDDHTLEIRARRRRRRSNGPGRSRIERAPSVALARLSRSLRLPSGVFVDGDDVKLGRCSDRGYGSGNVSFAAVENEVGVVHSFRAASTSTLHGLFRRAHDRRHAERRRTHSLQRPCPEHVGHLR